MNNVQKCQCSCLRLCKVKTRQCLIKYFHWSPFYFSGDKDKAQTLPGRTGLGPGQQRPMIGRPMSVNSSFDSHTSHNHNPHPRDPSFARDSSFDSRRSGPDTGYYSDRNDAARNGYRDERGYLSDHSSRYAPQLKSTNNRKSFNFRGLAPNYRQDSIRSGYISDHESRSGYERGGELST